jgi:rhodanese-related sulfurtransferase
MKTITPQSLMPLLLKNPDLTLIDVRSPAEFNRVHVPGAKLIPLHQLNAYSITTVLPHLDHDLYIFCESGGRAKYAADILEEEGTGNPIVVEGGVAAWEAAGLTVERGIGGVISLERQVRIGAGSLVVLGIILGFAVHKAFFVLSSLVGAGLVFAGITDLCGLGLLLARAPWNGASSKKRVAPRSSSSESGISAVSSPWRHS